MNDLLGHRLGQYEIVSEIGRGGMAIVYKAFQPSLNRTVAIKVLPPHLAIDKVFVERFLQEARSAARLEHPNIVPIHDVGESNGRYYIVMRYLPGKPLHHIIRESGHLALPAAARILSQVASALDHAHRHGVVHRDIKPANILVEPDGAAVLTDFGIAKAGGGGHITQAGTVMGTPEYMSPEQATGRPVGPASDIYALGLVLYEMLAGRGPFRADSGLALLHKHVYEAPPSIRSVAPNLPAGVDQVLACALAKDPARRFRSAGALAEAFRRAAGLEPGPVTPPRGKTPVVSAMARRPSMQPPSKRMPAALWIGLGGVAILMIALLSLRQDNPQQVTPTPVSGPVRQPPMTVVGEVTPALPQSTQQPSRSTRTSPTPIAATRPQVLARQVIAVYKDPWEGVASVGQTVAGQTFDIVATNAERTWWRVCCVNGEVVWIRADLVDVIGDTAGVTVIARAPPTATLRPLSTIAPAPTRSPVPRQTQPPSVRPPTVTPKPPPRGAVGSKQCPHAGSCFSYPAEKAQLSGTVAFEGSANTPNLQYYKVEFSADGQTWGMLHSAKKPVVNGVLFVWVTSTVPAGGYYVRLTVVDNTGNYLPEAIVFVLISR